MSDKKARKIDWEAIERDYRAGVLSIREIAKLHDVSDKAVRNKAKDFSWERDLTEKVNEKVRSELVRSQSAPADQMQTEKEIVDNAASIVIQIVRSHRARIGTQMKIADTLTEQLQWAIDNRDQIEDFIEDETKDDKDGRRRSQLLRAVSLGGHITALANLTNATQTLVGMERESFGIDTSADFETRRVEAITRTIIDPAKKA